MALHHRRRPPIGKGAVYKDAEEFATELATIATALKKQGAGLLASGRLRTVQLFGRRP